MKACDPPRLPVALLRRFVHDNEPLVGDLLEGFAVRQSRLWFWRQVLLAILIRSFQQRDDERPLGLVEHSPFVPGEREPAVKHPRRINLTGSPVQGVGGLGLVALGALVALVRPQAWWILLPGILGGVVLGVAMVIIRRHGALSASDSGSRSVLRGSDDVDRTA